MAVNLKQLLNFVSEKGCSDLHLTVGIPPVIRLHGGMKPLNVPPLTNDDTDAFMRAITPERCQIELKERGSTDFGFAYEKISRFRVCAYKQKGNIGIALRLIPNELLSFEDIGVPPSVKNLLHRPRGLFCVTGPTGSGKTTTLATMLDFINDEMDCHIITIEDPIEYFHSHKKSIITQREIRVDVKDFADGIRAALRMDPDVVLVGEMRDIETIRAAITAAETGHLVFATLHTIGAADTVNRMINAFPVDEQEQIRTQLAGSLLAVITQNLLPTTEEYKASSGKGRIAAFEIMVLNTAIAHMIRDNQVYKIMSAIQTGAQQGMITMDDFLYNLFIQKKISYQGMMEAAYNPGDLEAKVKAAFATKK